MLARIFIFLFSIFFICISCKKYNLTTLNSQLYKHKYLTSGINKTKKEKIIKNEYRFKYIYYRDRLIETIKKKYGYKTKKIVKGTVGGSTIHHVAEVLSNIYSGKIKSEKAVTEILNRIYLIVQNIYKSKKIYTEEASISDIDINKILIDNNINLTESKRTSNEKLILFFKNLSYKLTNEQNKVLKSILKTIFDIDKIENKEQNHLSILSQIELLLKSNILSLYIFRRGIFSQNEKWWNLNDIFLKDQSGIKLYYKYKNKISDPIISLNIFGEKINFVVDNNFMEQILKDSPYIFKEGISKKNVFYSFIPKNVGISTDKEWKYRRKLNVYALEEKQLHSLSKYFNKSIKKEIKLLKGKILCNYYDFNLITKKIVSSIIFNDEKQIPEELFKVLESANSFMGLTKNYQIKDKKSVNITKKYIKKNMKYPNNHSLVKLGSDFIAKNRCPYRCDIDDEFYNQIPHWIFPMVSLLNVDIPRALLMIANHPKVLSRLKNELSKININNSRDIYQCQYLRNCILESLRLNNLVNSLFRTLKRPLQYKGKKKYTYSFDLAKKHTYEEGEQFVFLTNPILRDPEKFSHPNEFKPERWNRDLEESFYSLQFSHGPQECPGKEIALFLGMSFLAHYLSSIDFKLVAKEKIDTNNIKQMFNPFKINFN